MSAGDQIDALATRTQGGFDDVFNFGEHNDLIWEDFEARVRMGSTLKARVAPTRTDVTEQDLIDLYPRYRATYVQGLSFVQLTMLFEAFLFDFLQLLLTNDPRHLAQKKQIEVGIALSAVDRGALILLIADRELNELKYDRPKTWFDYLNRIVNLGCPTEDEIERIAEMKAARDLLIHNSGMVNKIYLDKTGMQARYAVGERVVIDRPYFDDCWALARKVVEDIAVAAKRRLSKPASP